MAIFQPIISRYHDILRRIHDVEIVKNILLFDTLWQDDPAKYLNSQKKRQEIVHELKSMFDFEEILETGTFLAIPPGISQNYSVPL